MMSKRLAMAAIAAIVGVAVAGKAEATPTYGFTVETANQGGTSFAATPNAPGFNTAGAITATFNYSGPLSFAVSSPQNSTSAGDLNAPFFSNGTISNYAGSGTLAGPANANFTSLSTFLASSGSASNFQYGSLYRIDLGVLAAGTILTITHDDGASVYQGATQVGTTVTGPTVAVTDQVTIASSGDTLVYYARENGSPSVLNVAVPEPGSIALLGVGLLGFGLAFSRRRAL